MVAAPAMFGSKGKCNAMAGAGEESARPDHELHARGRAQWPPWAERVSGEGLDVEGDAARRDTADDRPRYRRVRIAGREDEDRWEGRQAGTRGITRLECERPEVEL